MTIEHLKAIGTFMGAFAISTFVLGTGLNALAKSMTDGRCMTDPNEIVKMVKSEISMDEYCTLKRELIAENGG